MNKNATKRSLLASVMALMLCVAMLVGTTFAWFTDTASTSVNKIQSGSLKMEVSYKNTVDGEFAILDEDTDVFKTDEVKLWEPGHVEFVVLKVENVGTLALKYKLGINIANETGSTNVYNNEFKLSEFIKYAVVNGDLTADPAAATRAAMMREAGAGTSLTTPYTKDNGVLNEKNDANTVTLVVWMPEDVGNDANHAPDKAAPVINLGINVAATQNMHENDSFDNTYDEDAQYPIFANSQTDIDDAIQATAAGEKTTIMLPVGTYNLTNAKARSKNIEFIGNRGGESVLDICQNLNGESGVNSGMNYQDEATITFDSLTILAQQSGNWGGIVRATTVFKNCIIKGKLTLYGDTTFINCTFENANDYSVWSWGAKNVTFDKCVFETGGKAINLYGGAGSSETPTTVMNVNSCVFNDSNNGAKGKAAIEIGNDYNATYILNVTDVYVNGFANGMNTDSKIWANKTSMDTDHLSVTIDNVKVY